MISIESVASIMKSSVVLVVDSGDVRGNNSTALNWDQDGITGQGTLDHIRCFTTTRTPKLVSIAGAADPAYGTLRSVPSTSAQADGYCGPGAAGYIDTGYVGAYFFLR